MGLGFCQVADSINAQATWIVIEVLHCLQRLRGDRLGLMGGVEGVMY